MFEGDPLEEVRNLKKMIEMAVRFGYLSSLLQVLDTNTLLDLTSKYSNHLDDISIYPIIESKINECESLLKPKHDWQIVFRNLAYLISNNDMKGFLESDASDPSNIYIRNYRGILMKDIVDNFEISGLLKINNDLSDLPLHGYVFDSKGQTAETHILLNAYHYMTKSKFYMKRYGEILNGKMVAELDYKPKQLQNELYMQINFSSIQAFLNMITFVECFVNSVANDFIIATSPEKDVSDYLLEIGGNHSTQEKLLTYPKLIHNESVKEIRHYWSSNKHRIEDENFENPYQPYLKSFKELRDHRDSYIHHSPNQFIDHPKTPIILNPIDWYEYAVRAFNVCIPIAKQFWKECGHENGPHYLFELDTKQLDHAGCISIRQEYDVLIDLKNNGYF